MPPATAPFQKTRILLVDDEQCILNVFSTVLKTEGYEVGTASNGLDALTQFQSARWDLVLTDRRMPEMDGVELSRRIKECSPRTPVIIMTGFAPPDCCPSVDAIITKPFSRDHLNAVINECLEAYGHRRGEQPDGDTQAAGERS